MDYYIAPDGNELYGIVPTDSKYDHSMSYRVPTNTHLPPATPQFSPTSPALRSHDTTSRPPSRANFFNLLLITATAMALLGLIVAYSINSTPTSFEHFMDSQTFGPRFLLSTLGLLVKSPLLALCARATASIPFSRLASLPRHAALDLLDPVPVMPISSIWYALYRRQWFAASVAVAAGIVVEVLLILLPGVPYEGSEFFTAGLASWYGSMGCLGAILLVAVAGWVRLLASTSQESRWPKPPTTLGAVAMYVAGSGMAEDFAASRLRQGAVAGEARYRLAMRGGRWVVDYADGLLSHGYDRKQSRDGVSIYEEHVARFPKDMVVASPDWKNDTAYDSREWRQHTRFESQYGTHERRSQNWIQR